MVTENAPQKSCLTCSYACAWSHPGSLYEPPDSGWDCQLEEAGDAAVCAVIEQYEEEHGEVNEHVAEVCPCYHYQEPCNEPEFEVLTPEDIAKLRQIAEEAETARLIAVGYMTEDGELTDEFFAASDRAYDARR